MARPPLGTTRGPHPPIGQAAHGLEGAGRLALHEGPVRISGEAPSGLVITATEGNPTASAPRREEGVQVVMSGRSGAGAPPPVSEAIEDKQLPNSGCRGLDGVVGQWRPVEGLRLLIAGAKNEPPLAPMLLTGAPGLGKSSIAEAIAVEPKAPLRIVSGPHVRDAATFIAALVATPARSVLFVDVIHAPPIEALNVLLARIDERSHFEFIAATDHPERLRNALRHARAARRLHRVRPRDDRF